MIHKPTLRTTLLAYLAAMATLSDSTWFMLKSAGGRRTASARAHAHVRISASAGVHSRRGARTGGRSAGGGGRDGREAQEGPRRAYPWARGPALSVVAHPRTTAPVYRPTAGGTRAPPSKEH